MNLILFLRDSVGLKFLYDSVDFNSNDSSGASVKVWDEGFLDRLQSRETGD